jgi:hypothetical protein
MFTHIENLLEIDIDQESYIIRRWDNESRSSHCLILGTCSTRSHDPQHYPTNLMILKARNITHRVTQPALCIQLVHHLETVRSSRSDPRDAENPASRTKDLRISSVLAVMQGRSEAIALWN